MLFFLSSAWMNVETVFQALDRKTSCHSSTKKQKQKENLFRFLSHLSSFWPEWSSKHWTGLKHHVITQPKKRTYLASHLIYHRFGMVFQALDRKTSCHNSTKKRELISLLISFIIVLEWSFKHLTGKHHVIAQPKKITYLASHLIYNRFGRNSLPSNGQENNIAQP